MGISPVVTCFLLSIFLLVWSLENIPVHCLISIFVLVLHQHINCHIISCLHEQIFHTIITFDPFGVQTYCNNFSFKFQVVVLPIYNPTM